LTDSLSLEDQILIALRRITRAIDLRSRMLLQDYGLTAPQLITLHAVARLQPVTAGVLARQVLLGQPTVTGILDRLEHRGLVQRTRGERDRRSVTIRLTAEGQRVLHDAPSPLQDQFQRRLGQLEQWERTQILATLQRIADMMDAAGIEAAPVLSSEFADATVEQPLRGEEVVSQLDDSTTVQDQPTSVERASRGSHPARGLEDRLAGKEDQGENVSATR
jgi:DNA-binding MarR family transcriptional regulator